MNWSDVWTSKTFTMLIFKPTTCIQIHHFTSIIRKIPLNTSPRNILTLQPIHRTYTTHKLNRNAINKIANLFNGKRRLVTLITKRFTTTNTKNAAQQVVKENSAPKRSDFHRLFLLGKNEKWVFLAAMGCLLVSSGITMGVPYSIGRILDIIFTEQVAKEKLKEFCVILVGIFIVGGFANFGRIYLMNGACKLHSLSLRIWFVSIFSPWGKPTTLYKRISKHFSSPYHKRSSCKGLSNNDKSGSRLVRH